MNTPRNDRARFASGSAAFRVCLCHSPSFIIYSLLLLLVIFRAGSSQAQQQTSGTNYSFFVAGDMRDFLHGTPSKRLFDGACDTMKQVGPAAFLMSPGDCDPPASVREVIDTHLGTNFLWYPVVGNHDVETTAKKRWWTDWAGRGIPHMVRFGPKGDEAMTYSFDFGNSHFVMLDKYFDGHTSAPSQSLSGATLDWLQSDLAANHQPLVWVSAHPPIKSVPDMETGRVRHGGESLTADAALLDRFLSLLRQYHVTAYICGHTHDCSIEKIDGVWQLDSGHCRGGGDTGAPSTFMKINVNGLEPHVEVYRSNSKGLDYQIKKRVVLN